MQLLHHALDIACFEFVQEARGRLVDFVKGAAAVVDAGEELAVVLVVLRLELGELSEGFCDAVVDDLDAVVEVGELVCLGVDVGGEDVLEDFGNIGVGIGVGSIVLLLLLGVGLLLVALLRGEDLLLLVLGRAGFVGLFARVRVGSGDDKAVDFERVGVLGA